MESKKTVVIVDDSPIMTDVLTGFFQDIIGFRVLATGSNGIHAVNLYRQHRPDLITMDLIMPVKDGKTALKEILAEHPEARVLMVSSQLGQPIVDCLRLGASGYVEKPLQFESRQYMEEVKATIQAAVG